MMLLKLPLPYIRKMPFNRGGGRHHRADQMRASAAALAPFEISIAGGGATLAGLQDVGIHAEAHRASRFTPLKTGIDENAVQAFLLRRALDVLRTGHNHGTHFRIHVATSGNPRRRT